MVIVLGVPAWFIAAALVAMLPSPIPLWVSLPIAESAAFAMTAYGTGEGRFAVVVIAAVPRLLDAILRYSMRARPEAIGSSASDIP